MKHQTTILILGALCLFSACQTNTKSITNNFSLNVTARNFPDSTKVVLYNRDIDQNIDSTYVINQQFTMTGTADIPALSYLYFYDAEDKNLEPYTYFYLEPNSIEINGDYNTFLDAKITGSSQTTLERSYDSIYTNIVAEAKIELPKITDSLQRVKASIAYGDQLQQQQKEFLFKHANNQMSLHKILYKKKTIKKDSLMLFYKALDYTNANSIKGKELYEYASTKDIKPGDPFRDITGVDLEGQPHKLSDFQGKVILLDFWGTGCVPCRKQNKSEFQELYSKFKDDDFVLISYSLDKQKKYWEKSSKQDDIKWLNISDLKGFSSANVKQYAVQAIPNSFLIDKNGILVKSFIGFSDGNGTIETEIEKLLD